MIDPKKKCYEFALDFFDNKKETDRLTLGIEERNLGERLYIGVCLAKGNFDKVKNLSLQFSKYELEGLECKAKIFLEKYESFSISSSSRKGFNYATQD